MGETMKTLPELFAEVSGNATPRHPSNRVVRGGVTDPVLVRDALKRAACAPKIAHLPYKWSAQFRVGMGVFPGIQPTSNSVINVLSVGHILKVCQPVVCWAPVNVVDFKPFRSRADKRQHDKGVNAASLRLPMNTDSDTGATTNHGGHENLACKGSFAVGVPANPSKATHRVNPVAFGNNSPLFRHHATVFDSHVRSFQRTGQDPRAATTRAGVRSLNYRRAVLAQHERSGT